MPPTPTSTPRSTPTPTPAPTLASTPTPASTQASTRTVNISLESGWNLFSFNVMPVSSGIENLLSSIEGQYTVVETFDGETLSYYPGNSTEQNTLETLDPYHGYWIKMEQPGILSITGTPVVATAPLSLQEGWNLVSYLGGGPLPVSTALSSIDGLYTAVLGYDGQAVSFYPALPAEMNTLEVLKPSYGYWIKMSAPATLIYQGSQ